MWQIRRWWKAGAVSIGVLWGLSALAGRAFAAGEAGSCATAAHRQFDFWVGDWEVFEVGNPIKVADARIAVILDGCVLSEDYRGTDGQRGRSLTAYDAARKAWHQSWVTNRGQQLEIEGAMAAGQVTLSGTDRAAGTLVRGTWKPVNAEVRETAVISSDGGSTWKPWFDLLFRRTPHEDSTDAPNSRMSTADREAVAALDTEYQAAVRANDTATMARILSDDFVLVTGAGKAYTKSDLLEEARSGHVHYELQDDTDQTVRIWGDTAVITARLAAKGTNDGKHFDYHLWFSDTYVRTPAGWRYVFGQASSRLP